MTPKMIKSLLRASMLMCLIPLVAGCFMGDIKLREIQRPIRKYFNKERTYWSDRIDYRGEMGVELIYYKNGRPALERVFDESGLLKQVSYLNRQGSVIRMDSLVYVDDKLIGAYYFSEPNHQLELRFLSYNQQGQLSQRSWFDGKGQLLSREFFLFDRQGQRRMRMIFDGDDVLLFSETFKASEDELELQNTYSVSQGLVSQVRYGEHEAPVEYQFSPEGTIEKISQLRKDGTTAWTNHLLYNKAGAVIQSNFSTSSRFIVSYMGALEFFQQQARTWKHPRQPSQKLQLLKYGHRDPFVREETLHDLNQTIVEYRFPQSKGLFKKSIYTSNGRRLNDTLYGGGLELQPAIAMAYDDSGLVVEETSYDLQGAPRWRRDWYRDDQGRVIREEVTALPDTFAAALTRFYDCLGHSAFSERFTQGGVFEGTWVNYHGGGVKKTLFYNADAKLTESWLFRPAGDTTQHSTFKQIAYFTVESRLGSGDTLLSQRRFTHDGVMDWELFFDARGQLIQETHHKKNGELYRNVSYDPSDRSIVTTTYAPSFSDDARYIENLKPEVSSHIVSKLNHRGDLIQRVSRNTSGDVEWETRFAYRQGRLIKSAQLNAQSKPVVISTYTHNDQGNVLTETAVDQNGNQVHFIEKRYNEAGLLMWTMFISDVSGQQHSNRYYYDDLGRLQRNEIIESKHFLEAVEYEYYPDQYLRIATHYDAEGTLLRKEVENYFGNNVFAMTDLVNNEEN